MNGRNSFGRVAGVALMIVSFWSPGRVASAQSPNTTCKHATGVWIDVYPGTGNTTLGTITNGGILNGTTQSIFTSGAFPTPAATIVSYTSELTITTNHGNLKTTNTYLYDFETGTFTLMGRINPQTSTGQFAGVTGTFFANGKTTGNGFTYPAEIAGEICFDR